MSCGRWATKENESVEVEVTYDTIPIATTARLISLPNSPVPLGGLGLGVLGGCRGGRRSSPVPAAADGEPPAATVVTAVRFKTETSTAPSRRGDWDDVKSHQWASVDAAFQSRPPHEMDLKVKRATRRSRSASRDGRTANWPTDDRGLIFQQDFRTQKATDIVDARHGRPATVRFIKEVYMNLYAMIFGRVSAKTMSGPLTIANVSYRFAGEDFWQFLLFIGMISVNLAVVNFLPIPVLDGGHMVFLILEKILGRPVPEKVFAFAMYLGLAMILSLMIFVITLDIRRLFFGECVLIQEDGRRTACISTQVGCGMGCVFCASGLNGVDAQPDRRARSSNSSSGCATCRRRATRAALTHIVVMGMGEPLANLDNLLEALDGRHGEGRPGHRRPAHHDLDGRAAREDPPAGRPGQAVSPGGVAARPNDACAPGSCRPTTRPA